MNTWIISDTHFGHGNIITYCSRPYVSNNLRPNVDAMDRDLIRRWNNRVAPTDLIYHLGDFGYALGKQELKTREEYMQELLSKLHGTKILIVGNHDKSAERMMEFGFDFACEEMVIAYFGQRLLLTHKPRPYLPSNIDFVLHGHIHNHSDDHLRQFEHKGEIVPNRRFNINLSVEVINYEPQSLRAVVSQACARRAGKI